MPIILITADEDRLELSTKFMDCKEDDKHPDNLIDAHLLLHHCICMDDHEITNNGAA
ncbi:unnamed protein product [Dovyalis caffra]|uniref:Uncharacterized protein n=1 Tax=Dovyalis caffra TaxID=77055 RepID=A0AAV1S2Q0_9ROSI|nr:unnamed protein product [Dovyalis caffra]